MRPDQIARLNDLSEKLADRFLVEADPVEWPGGGATPADMTQQERGDSYWCKKNAMATGGVLRYTLDLVKSHSAPGGDDAEGASKDADMDKKINEAERRAAAAVARALDKAKKRTFDAKVNGK
jgi:hypothetical protein